MFPSLQTPVCPSHHPPQPWNLRPDYLLTNYPDLDLALPDTGGDDPLHLAAYNGRLGIVPWPRLASRLFKHTGGLAAHTSAA